MLADMNDEVDGEERDRDRDRENRESRDIRVERDNNKERDHRDRSPGPREVLSAQSRGDNNNRDRRGERDAIVQGVFQGQQDQLQQERHQREVCL